MLNYLFQRRAGRLRDVRNSEHGSAEEQWALRGVATFDRHIFNEVREHPAYVEMLADEQGTARLAALALSEAKASHG